MSGGIRTPLFSIVTPVYEPPADVLSAMIDSVRSQTFDAWQLVLVDDASPSGYVREVLRAAAAEDDRITLIERSANGGIVASSNDGLAAARGEFIVLVDHDDLITRDALRVMADAIESNPEADYLYSDEDKIDASGRYYDLFEKPDWSPERLRSQMYTGHLSVLRASSVAEAGGFRPGFDGSQDHDLVLRVTERARRIVHVPEVLYHWRVVPGSAAGDSNAKPYAWVAGRRAVDEHLQRVGIDGTAQFGVLPGYYRIARKADPQTRVSVIIPTRGSAGMIWGERRVFVVDAVSMLLRRAGHTQVEVVVVHDTDTPPAVLAELEDIAGRRLVLVEFTEPFNFSAKCNAGFVASSGDVIVLLNDDTEPISDNFLADLIAPLREPDVGMTGARLLYSDGTVQHAGHVYQHDSYRDAYRGVPDENYEDFGALLVNREASGLTAACVALRRGVYEEVGGLCESLPGSFNDVDFCLKIRSRGYRLIWLADVRLYHFESKTRDPSVQRWEHQFVIDRWATPDRDLYLPAGAR